MKRSDDRQTDRHYQFYYLYSIIVFFLSLQHKELKQYMFEEKLKSLNLDEEDKIGYVYKCMGSGFWALKQHDFRTAIQSLLLEV